MHLLNNLKEESKAIYIVFVCLIYLKLIGVYIAYL